MLENDSKGKLIQEEDDNERFPDVFYTDEPKKIAEVTQNGQRFLFRSQNNIDLEVTVITGHIIQVRYYLEGDRHTDFSYAIDPDFNPTATDIRIDEHRDYYQLSTERIFCRIMKKNMLVHFYDHEGNVLCEEDEGFSRRRSIMKGIKKVKISKKAPRDESYFGLGDKACGLNLRGASFENWNTDSYEYERGDDPLYRSIPFYSSLHDGRAYGIFLDNTYRTHFDFDSKKLNSTSFYAEGGVMNYYFIYGPELRTVSERYTQLTGTPEMAPLWAFGYHQCRWSYFPESQVRELANSFREKKIPCDAIYLDIDYMDDYRCFTWNNDYFPDPYAMIQDFREQGFETIVMIDPGIKAADDYFVYQQGKEGGHFCKRPDGETMIGPVWPEDCAFPDYTKPEVREWWADLYEDHLASKKIGGIWNDMNEPAVFEVNSKTFPDDIRHDYDGHACSHRKAHNIYGMQMARASLMGIKKHNKEKRPFLLTRANFAGGQRYAALWTGDNIASWDHLRLANEQCQRLSISGYSFIGTDIGGFVENPSPELFTRWLQLSVFHPLFRNHTMGYNVDGAAAIKESEVEAKKRATNAYQEPWVFGDAFTDINRETIELRYRLLHYLYTAYHDYVEDGVPVIKPLSYYDQSDAKAVKQEDEFIFGEDILVAPVLKKGKKKRSVYLPRGGWYDFRDNTFYEGKKEYLIDAPLADIPFFVKSGSVLPLREVMQYTKERNPKQLELNVYYGDKISVSTLYEDAEDGHGYTEGDFLLSHFRMKPAAEKKKVSLTVERNGDFTPVYNKVIVNFIGLPFKPENVWVDGQKKVISARPDNKSVFALEVVPGFEKIIIE